MSKELSTNQTASLSNTEGFDHIQRVSKALATSDIIPKSFSGNVSNCIIAVLTANDIGKSPIFVMNNSDVIHGSLSWKSTYIVSAINTCGKFSALRYKYNKDKTACTAYAKDLETGEIIEGTTITMAMADAEGWTKKSGSKWKTMPEQMLAYRAATFFGRMYVPEIMNGMKTTEEAVDIESYKTESDAVQEINDRLRHSEAPLVEAEVIEDDNDLVD